MLDILGPCRPDRPRELANAPRLHATNQKQSSPFTQMPSAIPNLRQTLKQEEEEMTNCGHDRALEKPQPSEPHCPLTNLIFVERKWINGRACVVRIWDGA
ncbi:hypothetical protein RRG08_056816 [Elysia crispata]|uniref:Uncharacterized protein n=1 Tax=Elysia crispata TaxID=231223 RepID=A0AAE1DWE8_9GAST|nr:hypothetical protein RRG08_056816 [Elysia crispata]